jgi:hypothetical protein
LQLCLSEADFNDHKRQFAEAEAFLRHHYKAISAITTRTDTLDSVLDFGLAQSPAPAFYRRLPVGLIQIAASLRLSIELSFYAVAREATFPCDNEPHPK